MLNHPLTNFEIQKNYQNGTKFIGSYSNNNFPKSSVINLDEYNQ